MRKYFIRKVSGEGTARLWTRIQKKNPKIDIWVNTLIDVDADEWQEANNGKTESFFKYSRTISGKQTINQLNQIDKILDNFVFSPSITLTELDAKKEEIRKAIEDYVFADARKAEKERKEEEERKKKITEEQRKNNVLLWLDKFLEDIKSGKRLNKGNVYDSNTCKVWNSFRLILGRFMDANPFSWSSVDRTLADKFVSFLMDEGYMNKSINKYVVCFRAMVNYAYQDKTHTNIDARECFSKVTIKESDKAREIYLTSDEIDSLYQMDSLSATESMYRDVFLCGVFTCQRFSDYSRFNKDMFQTTFDGTKVIVFEQEKTGNKVVIPILNDNLITILERYDYNLPKVSDVVLNRYIKQILKRLSEQVPSLAEVEPTLLTMKEIQNEKNGKVKYNHINERMVLKPRYDLVSTHTARRSGITNLYLSGLFDSYEMMRVSGHKSESTFIEYIKLSGEEVASKMAKKMARVGV